MAYTDLISTEIDDAFIRHPGILLLAHQTLVKIKNGEVDEFLLDCIVQPYREYSIYDGFIFLKIWSEILSGNILFTKISLGDEPYNDKLVEYNDGVLKKLKSPFSATFWGGSGDFDGNFISKKAMIISDQNGIRYAVDTQGCHIPLEVGSTKSQTTFSHLFTNRCGAFALARWPYHSKDLGIFINRFTPWVDLKTDKTVEESQRASNRWMMGNQNKPLSKMPRNCIRMPHLKVV